MVTFNTAWSSLRAEMVSDIHKMGSNRWVEPEHKFIEFKSSPDHQDIKRYSAAPRQFQIYAPKNIEIPTVGGSTSTKAFAVDIVFAYPATDAWDCAALDDTDKIRTWFIAHPSRVTGVMGRWSDVGDIVTSEDSEDMRRYWTLRLSIQIEITR